MSENNIENNGGAPEAPKKKQIVHVFRPQNTQNAKQQGRRGQQGKRDGQGQQPHPSARPEAAGQTAQSGGHQGGKQIYEVQKHGNSSDSLFFY